MDRQWEVGGVAGGGRLSARCVGNGTETTTVRTLQGDSPTRAFTLVPLISWFILLPISVVQPLKLQIINFMYQNILTKKKQINYDEQYNNNNNKINI